jgi:hypothetical protein
MKRVMVILVALASAFALAAPRAVAARTSGPRASSAVKGTARAFEGLSFTSNRRLGQLAAPTGDRRGGANNSTFECVTAPTSDANVTLDCPDEYALPTDEPAIAVDPMDPNHIVTASLNERWPKQTIQVATSFDGGSTWTIGDLPRTPHTTKWDPWLAFDVKRGTVVLAFEKDDDFTNPTVCFQDQLVTTSSDGGLTWGGPIVAVPTRGDWCNAPGAVFEEGKITIDNDPASPYFGRSWITADYIACKTFVLCRTPIAETHSDDGGVTWTSSTLISGSNGQYCTAPPGQPLCDSDSPPALVTLAPDGSMYVAFLNAQSLAAQERGELRYPGAFDHQILVVKSTDGGETWSPPVHVVDLEDGGGDIVCTRSYYRGCRLSSIALTPDRGGYMAAAPDGTLYLVFSDNRNGRHDLPNPHTNEDVFVMTSGDGGQTWSGPDLVAGAQGDEWNPNIAVDPVSGQLGILYYDRSDSPSKTMNVSLAQGLPGSFSITRITTEPSHLSEDLWWAQSLPDCHRCVYHIGEYLGIAFGSDGMANMVWADLRRFEETPFGDTGYSMNVDYARSGG